VITEGILNRSIQLVPRSDARSRDSSRYDASPDETAVNLNQRQGGATLGESPVKALDRIEETNLTTNQESKIGTPTESDLSKEAEQSESAFKKIIAETNQKLNRSDLKLRFGTDEESGIDYFQLYDKENGDVVKQFPPEEILKVIANLKDMAGIIFNEKV
jgi:flagellar protein FlaG